MRDTFIVQLSTLRDRIWGKAVAEQLLSRAQIAVLFHNAVQSAYVRVHNTQTYAPSKPITSTSLIPRIFGQLAPVRLTVMPTIHSAYKNNKKITNLNSFIIN